jgi:hypothetical protein
LQLSSPYAENKNPVPESTKEKTTEIKAINIHNNIIINSEVKADSNNSSLISLFPKYTIKASENQANNEKISNTMDSVNNNNFASILNHNYQCDSGIMRYDSNLSLI